MCKAVIDRFHLLLQVDERYDIGAKLVWISIRQLIPHSDELSVLQKIPCVRDGLLTNTCQYNDPARYNCTCTSP